MNTQSDDDTHRAFSGPKRTRKTRPYPNHTLEDALTIAGTIQESNAGLALDRELLAGALGTTPKSSDFIMRLNSSAKYGLTRGAYNDARISLTPRGQDIVTPKGGDEQHGALVAAAMEPDVFRRFYQMLDGKRLPADTYAQSMLQRDLGIHSDLTSECLSIIKANGLYVGTLDEVGDSLFVELPERQERVDEPQASGRDPGARALLMTTDPPVAPGDTPPRGGKVFIGHGGNSKAVEFVESVLHGFGISYETGEGYGSDNRPVPARVSDQMRSCSAAILVFGGKDDTDDGDETTSAESMQYQIGAASALYGDRLVILREFDVERSYDGAGDLPSVAFERENPDEAGLALLRGLQRAGVVRVVV